MWGFYIFIVCVSSFAYSFKQGLSLNLELTFSKEDGSQRASSDCYVSISPHQQEWGCRQVLGSELRSSWFLSKCP